MGGEDQAPLLDIGGEHKVADIQPRMLIIILEGENLEIRNEGISAVEAPIILRLAAKLAERKLGL